ncbi:MAG: acyl-[acyl-carrier-protein] thioesterase [Acidobacteriota bacterium]|nr:acyl-[acyl-carrier-protein] thioesterase [Acidobacteriota bacterium]
MRKYTRAFRVRHYELDSFGHVNNAVYANYLQEAAIEASADAGFTPAWYEEKGTGWVIRELSIRYHLQASYNDELEVTTWVSNIRRVSSTREYLIERASDKARVARARVNWVYLDMKRGKPARVTDDFVRALEPSGEWEELGIRLQNPRKTDDAFRYRAHRRVQTYELDALHHVNNAVYLNWIEQAYFDALRAAGHPISHQREAGWWALQGGHEIEYFEAAFDNDEIEIVSWVCEMGRVRGSWIHEIYNAATKKLLARDYSLGIFINGDGKLVAPPQNFIDDVLRGP